jgi:16S rRNA (uracil1498-N3)-methyltransferase
MRRRFFVHKLIGDRAFMVDDAAHHLGRVLRAQKGQLYELSDGAMVRLARIESVTRDRVEFELLEELPAYRPSVETTLLLSIVKFDAFEWGLEKATELGVSRIVPLAAARSEKALITAAGKRAERWRKILLEASQQSRRLNVPTLEAVVSAEQQFRKQAAGLRILLSERADAPGLKSVLGGANEMSGPRVDLDREDGHGNAVPLRGSMALAIGPEGGWTDEELEAAGQAGFREASLGRLILRAETAVLSALSVLNYALGD